MVLLSCYHVEHLVILHISQLSQVLTFEQGRPGISHLRQSSCHAISSIVFMKSAKFIRYCLETQTNFQPSRVKNQAVQNVDFPVQNFDFSLVQNVDYALQKSSKC